MIRAQVLDSLSIYQRFSIAGRGTHGLNQGPFGDGQPDWLAQLNTAAGVENPVPEEDKKSVSSSSSGGGGMDGGGMLDDLHYAPAPVPYGGPALPMTDDELFDEVHTLAC